MIILNNISIAKATSNIRTYGSWIRNLRMSGNSFSADARAVLPTNAEPDIIRVINLRYYSETGTFKAVCRILKE